MNVTVEYLIKGQPGSTWCNPRFSFNKARGWYMHCSPGMQYSDGSLVKWFDPKNLKNWFKPGHVIWIKTTTEKVLKDEIGNTFSGLL